MSLANVKAQAEVVSSLMGRWCIDPDRVFFAGHSDGGTVSTLLAVLPETRGTARGIAVSAAGILQLFFKLKGLLVEGGLLGQKILVVAHEKSFGAWGLNTY